MLLAFWSPGQSTDMGSGGGNVAVHPPQEFLGLAWVVHLALGSSDLLPTLSATSPFLAVAVFLGFLAERPVHPWVSEACVFAVTGV